jgi:hypothetical protein
LKTVIPFFLAIISLTFFYCSEDSTGTPPVDQDSKGKLVINSNPSGAHIYLMGINTGKTTPDSIINLEQGIYDGFLYLQFYDTSYFRTTVLNNTTTTIDTSLEDGLPFVEFLLDYQSGGDTVRFYFTINQDITMDSIAVMRPINISGDYVTIKYLYNEELFEYQDQSGMLKKYYLPPPELGQQYFNAIQNYNYYFSMFGHKAYGAKVEFRSYYSVKL